MGKGRSYADAHSLGGVPTPAPGRAAVAAVARCAVVTVGLTLRHRIHQPRPMVGRVLHFADGSAARVYRVTALDVPAVGVPCVLVVGFRLRGVRGFGHALFRAESILNTPLFAGFPGFVSKLWLADDDNGLYRGVYDWDGAGRAESYVSALYRVLALVSEPGSIRFRVLPGLRRDEVLADPARITVDDGAAGGTGWWRVVRSAPGPIGRTIPPQRLVTAFNPVVRAVLRSPLHTAFDTSMLVLHLAGRRSGRTYDIPVGFTDLGDGRLLVVTQHRWRVNLRGGADVEITRGARRTPMHAELVEDPAAVALVLWVAIADRGPAEARRRFGLRIPTDHTPDVAELAAAARAFDLSAVLLAPPWFRG
jgi:hypothetical protein